MKLSEIRAEAEAVIVPGDAGHEVLPALTRQVCDRCRTTWPCDAVRQAKHVLALVEIAEAATQVLALFDGYQIRLHDEQCRCSFCKPVRTARAALAKLETL